MSIDPAIEKAALLRESSARVPRPLSTYRLQFHKDFTFNDAASIVPYLSKLGISHVYASPYLQAAPGSTHGYDVVNPEALNSECGTEKDYQRFLQALSDHGMSHILDIVPNHMGVGTDQNPWWNDVLEYGLSSPFAQFFDISWEDAGPSDLREKVVLPILGDEPEAIVEKGELKLVFDDHAFGLQYYERRLPITPASYPLLLEDEAAFAELAAQAKTLAEHGLAHYRQASQIKDALVKLAAEDEEAIHKILGKLNGEDRRPTILKLLNAQHYRLVFWRDAMATLNYRRFFDINDLAALRMERDEVFGRTHAAILQRLALGDITGVRVDHPDGLADPKRYFERLQSAFQRERTKLNAPPQRNVTTDVSTDDKPLYIVAEKILAFDESLDPTWLIDGATGYDYLAKLNAFFVNPAGKAPLSKLYTDFTGCSNDFATLAFDCKRLILQNSFSCELASLVRRVQRIARHILTDRCPAQEMIHRAVAEFIVHVPVYRSYLTDAEPSAFDRKVIEEAYATLRDRQPDVSDVAASFLRDLLLNQGEFAEHPEFRKQRWPVARRFQQLTAPVTAKGVEDTAVYRFHRLISLNEVGCEPDRFGLSISELHKVLEDRQKNWPHALSTLSTHDTKRSEDVRARLHVLADIPDRWRNAVTSWQQLNRQVLAEPLDANTEYLIYQTIVGAWSPGMKVPEDTFVSRIVAYALKAAREAKQNTNWTDGNQPYEARLEEFISGILDPKRAKQFLDQLLPFVQPLTRIGYINSLSQTLVKLTSPGVPDTYQGTELWDFSLVDPDNRRPVDYRLRNQMASNLTDAASALRSIDEGAPKLFLTQRVLRIRDEFADCFQSGSYKPVQVTGNKSDLFFAFAREDDDCEFVVIVPRFPGIWMPFDANASLAIPPEILAGAELNLPTRASYVNILTDQAIAADSPGTLPISAALSQFPVALLLRQD